MVAALVHGTVSCLEEVEKRCVLGHSSIRFIRFGIRIKIHTESIGQLTLDRLKPPVKGINLLLIGRCLPFNCKKSSVNMTMESFQAECSPFYAHLDVLMAGSKLPADSRKLI